MEERKRITMTTQSDDFSITMTQKVIPNYGGHVEYVIFNSSGDIVETGGTSCGAPKRKISIEWCDEYLESYIFKLERFGE